jgi:ammonium transporter Rh
VFLQPLLESKFKIVDTCGVHNLHGMPGLLGGLSAFLVVPGIAIAQFNGIMITLIIAIVGGLIAGAIIKATGTTREPYEDSVEFTHLAGPETEKLPEQLQTRVEALEIQTSTANKPHAPMESPETKALIARLELRVMTLESNIAAAQNRETGEKPESIA